MLDHAPVTLHFSITNTRSLVHKLIHDLARSLGQMHFLQQHEMSQLAGKSGRSTLRDFNVS